MNLMQATFLKNTNGNDLYQHTLKLALFASLGLHVVLVIMSLVGLPFMSKKEPISLPTPITVEFVKVDDVTQTIRQVKPQPKPKSQDKPKQDTKKSAPKVTSEAPPSLDQLRQAEADGETKSAAVPIPSRKPAPPKPKQKDPEPEEAPKTVEEPKKPDVPKASNNAFDSLLKNLAPDAKTTVEPEDVEDQRTLDDILSEEGQEAPLGAQMTISELDSIRQQLAPCWNIPAGAKYAENLAVRVRVSMGPDGSVIKASVLDNGRYNRDHAFRAAADSALRALRNPRCVPLDLPAEKYAQWKSIVINFDPQSML